MGGVQRNICPGRVAKKAIKRGQYYMFVLWFIAISFGLSMLWLNGRIKTSCWFYCLDEKTFVLYYWNNHAIEINNTPDAYIKISMYFLYVKKLSRNLIQEVAHAVLWLLYELVASRHVWFRYSVHFHELCL